MFSEVGKNSVAPAPETSSVPPSISKDNSSRSTSRESDVAMRLRRKRTTIEESGPLSCQQLRTSTCLTLSRKVELRSTIPAEIRSKSKFKEWASRQKQTLRVVRTTIAEVVARMELWRSSLKTIEGHHGSGVVSYFVFLKWLFLLNVFIFAFVFVFLVVPQMVASSQDAAAAAGSNTSSAAVGAGWQQCSALYTVNVSRDNVGLLLLDFLQGTGWMEQTVLFYGSYSNGRLVLSDAGASAFRYNLPLAYIVVTVVYMVVSLVMMVRHTGSSMRDSVLQSDGVDTGSSSAVFCGWDYSVYDDHTADLKHRGIYNQVKKDLYGNRHNERKRKRTSCRVFGLFLLRVVINVCVVAILAGAGYLIYITIVKSTELLESNVVITSELLGRSEMAVRFSRLVYEYLPSLVITALNIVVPPLFDNIARGEDYSADVHLKVTLGRTVFLRLASVAMLIATLYIQVTCSTVDQCDVGILPDCPPFRCWETYVGQQIYKLAILDFITVFLTLVFVDFPRRLLVTRCHCGLTRLIGKAEFDINKTVLDLVYSQTLCWMGAFFSPLIVAITVTKLFIIFYLRKINCMFNFEPPEKSFYASRSFAFFMVVLLTAYFLCCVPLAVVIWKLTPSKGCGPFRAFSSMYDVIPTAIDAWPAVIHDMLMFASSPAFIVPFFFVIAMILYYYRVASNSHKRMSSMLREQLILESKDKQYLLAKVCALTDQNNIDLV